MGGAVSFRRYIPFSVSYKQRKRNFAKLLSTLPSPFEQLIPKPELPQVKEEPKALKIDEINEIYFRLMKGPLPEEEQNELVKKLAQSTVIPEQTSSFKRKTLLFTNAFPMNFVNSMRVLGHILRPSNLAKAWRGEPTDWPEDKQLDVPPTEQEAQETALKHKGAIVTQLLKSGNITSPYAQYMLSRETLDVVEILKSGKVNGEMALRTLIEPLIIREAREVLAANPDLTDFGLNFLKKVAKLPYIVVEEQPFVAPISDGYKGKTRTVTSYFSNK